MKRLKEEMKNQKLRRAFRDLQVRMIDMKIDMLQAVKDNPEHYQIRSIIADTIQTKVIDRFC